MKVITILIKNILKDESVNSKYQDLYFFVCTAGWVTMTIPIVDKCSEWNDVKHMEITSTFILLLKTCPHMLFQSTLQPMPVNHLFSRKAEVRQAQNYFFDS